MSNLCMSLTLKQNRVFILRYDKFRKIAAEVAAQECIGGTLVTGVDAAWFFDELVAAICKYPEILQMNAGQIRTLIQGLYVLDAEDLMTCI